MALQLDLDRDWRVFTYTYGTSIVAPKVAHLVAWVRALLVNSINLSVRASPLVVFVAGIGIPVRHTSFAAARGSVPKARSYPRWGA